MKIIIKIILIAILCYFVQFFLPFWCVAIIAFLVNILIPTNGFQSFMSGFLGVGLLWFVLAFLIDSHTASILTVKISEVFSISPILLMLVTALIGGIVAGFGGLTASTLVSTKATKKKSKYYS